MLKQPKIAYRKDIEILRGIAVLIVLGYHLKVPGFQNGFLGVDIFFVLSGYLMSAIYQNGKSLEFYLRRARRLLPSYYLTVSVTILVCFFMVVPSDLRQVIEQSKYSMILIPNLFFWFQDSYFNNSNFNPLLHLWSLGIEFQFYLLIPVLLILSSKLRISRYIIFISSFLLCIVVLSVSPKTSFFLLPFRVWEFVLGTIAFDITRFNWKLRENPFFRRMSIPTTGLAIVIFLCFPIDGLSTSFLFGQPGFGSLVFSLLTVFYLLFSPRFKFATWLEVLGKHSYSIYLVHFPITVLFQYKAFSGTILNHQSANSLLAQVALIGILARVLHVAVEKPMRTREFKIKYLLYFILSIFLITLLLPNLKAQQLTKYEKQITESIFDRAQYRCGKLSRIIQLNDKVCVIGEKKFKKRILLLGNSHADAIKESFASAANENSLTTYFWVQNDPLMQSREQIQEIVNEIEKNEISSVYLHFSSGAVDEEILLNFFGRVHAKGTRIIILGPVPTWNKNVPQDLWANRNSTRKSLSLTQNYEEYFLHNFRELDFLTRDLPKYVEFVNMGRTLCNPNCLYKDSFGNLMYWDSGHLTLSGAKVLRPLLLAATRQNS